MSPVCAAAPPPPLIAPMDPPDMSSTSPMPLLGRHVAAAFGGVDLAEIMLGGGGGRLVVLLVDPAILFRVGEGNAGRVRVS